MNNLSKLEQDNKKKGRRISIAIHAILLLLAFFITIDGIPAKVDPMYEVAVNFSMEPSSNSTKSRSTSGKERPRVKDVTEIEQHQNKKVEVEVPTPTKVVVKTTPKATPTPTDPIVSEVVDEDETDVVAVEEEEDIEIEDPEEDVVPDPKPSKPKIDHVFKNTKKSDKSPSKSGGGKKTGKSNKDSDASNNKNGKGTGKGDKGTGKGSDKSGNDNDSGRGTGGVGSGEYDGSGDGIFGRKVVYVNRNYGNINLKGTMSIRVCINRAGNVLTCSIIEDETTVTDRNTLRKVLKLVKKYKFERKQDAPKEQCGKTRIVVEDKRNKSGQQTLSFW